MISSPRVFRYAGGFFRELHGKRRLILDLAIRNFSAAYHGSALGLAWVFIEPLIYMGVMYTFFTKAVKYSPSGGYPYMAWLMSSMVVWYFFSAVVQTTSTVFLTHSYLLKKWEFNMSILPVVTLLSSLFVHGVFLLLLVGIFFLSGVPFSLYWFQFLYYLFALCVLVIGLGWITASLSLFIKDTRNVISVCLQLGFWVSPIFWDVKSQPGKMRSLMKMNPLYYIMNGYRDSFLYHVPFWGDVRLTLYYWGFTLTVLALGMVTYKRLRPHFGDVI